MGDAKNEPERVAWIYHQSSHENEKKRAEV